MSNNIVKPGNFDESKLEFSEVKTNKYGGKSVWVRYNGERLLVQTPEMSFPYGLGEYDITDPKTGEVTGKKYSLNLSFRGIDYDGDDPDKVKNASQLSDFHQMLQNISTRVIKEATQNSVAWLKLKSPKDGVIEALYQPLINQSTNRDTGEPDGKYPDTFKGKIQYYDGIFKTAVYNMDKERVDLKENLVKSAYGKSLLEFTGVWFAGGKVGVGFKFVQLRVTVPQGLTGYAIISDSDDDSDDDSDNNNDIPVSNTEAVNTLDAGVESSSSSDDDDDDDDEEEEEPLPPAKGKKPKKPKS